MWYGRGGHPGLGEMSTLEEIAEVLKCDEPPEATERRSDGGRASENIRSERVGVASERLQ